MEPDKNETLNDESSSRVVESTNNTTTTDSTIDTVIRSEIEDPPLKKAKLGKTCRFKGCEVREGQKNATCAEHYNVVKVKEAFNRREQYAEK